MVLRPKAAGVRRSGLARQHAMADVGGGQSQGQDREELQAVARGTAFTQMSYEGMAVANGQDAGTVWESLVRRNWTLPSKAT
jgi:hypothetical protein